MKRSSTTSKKVAFSGTALAPKADRTLHIKWPWSMTWLESVDEMFEFLKSRIGLGHPLYGRKLYISAVRDHGYIWFVEGEKDPFYAIVYEGALPRRCRSQEGWRNLADFQHGKQCAILSLPEEGFERHTVGFSHLAHPPRLTR